jgi:hypothetical protein
VSGLHAHPVPSLQSNNCDFSSCSDTLYCGETKLQHTFTLRVLDALMDGCRENYVLHVKQTPPEPSFEFYLKTETETTHAVHANPDETVEAVKIRIQVRFSSIPPLSERYHAPLQCSVGCKLHRATLQHSGLLNRHHESPVLCYGLHRCAVLQHDRGAPEGRRGVTFSHVSTAANTSRFDSVLACRNWKAFPNFNSALFIPERRF